MTFGCLHLNQKMNENISGQIIKIMAHYHANYLTANIFLISPILEARAEYFRSFFGSNEDIQKSF